MSNSRGYHKRGTKDLPVAFYKIKITDYELSRNYWHPELEVGMVRKGTITMLIGNTSRSFAQGEIFIVPPNQLHGLHNASSGAVQHVLNVNPAALAMEQTHFFQKSFVEPLAEGRLTMPEVLRPDHPAYEAVATQLRRLAATEIYTQGYKLERYAAVLQICAALQPYCRVGDTSTSVLPTNGIVRQCVAYIRGNYAKRLTLGDIATGCSAQANYLCAVFKKQTGQTVMEYLNRTRIEIGAKRLEDREASIAEVMTSVGFSSEETFRENFRKFKGTTPREYRKKALQIDKGDQSI